MRIATWNVNSLKARQERVEEWLAYARPDVLCLQETKLSDAAFPHMTFSALGYDSVHHGQGQWNGVAILSRVGIDAVTNGFDGTQVDPYEGDARVITATCDGVRVVSVYVPNGREVGTEFYERKLLWLDLLHDWIAATYSPTDPVVVLGDFNVAPDDRDVHDPELWRGKNLASEPERARIVALEALGLTDLGRAAAGDVTGPFSWWDYRMGAFHRGWGLRIDLLLGSAPVAERLVSVEVDREERKPTSGEGKPSDHAPVVLTLADA